MENLKWLSKKVNRSLGQTAFLYELCDNDFEKLKALEVQIKNCHLYFCPADKETVESVMSMQPKSNFFNLYNCD